jgi:hypothetical protein
LPDYEVNMKAMLVDSYWVRLADPAPISDATRNALAAISGCSRRDWLQMVDAIRGGDTMGRTAMAADPMLV